MNISFINPLFLWGLPLVGIPIIIHLLTKKKAVKLAFSEVKFIQLASSKVIQRYRLTEFLLLLIRMLILLILILFFARPVFYALPLLGSGSEVSANIVFILDNSYSMGYEEEGQSRFVIARQIIKELVNKLDKRDRAALILMNSKAESPVGYFTFDKKILLSEIEKSNLSFYPTDISKALAKAYTILGDSISSNKQIVIITDLAVNGYKNITEAGVSKEFFKNFDEKVKLIFIDIASTSKSIGKSYSNLSISDVITEGEVINQSVKIKATIKNYGIQPIQDVPSSLYFDEVSQQDNFKKIAQHFLSIKQNTAVDKDFFCNFSRTGIYLGAIELNPDALIVDDKTYFKVSVKEKINVLCVDGTPNISFYNSETYYIKLALNPLVNEASINSQICSVTELETKNFEDFSVIIFCNVQSLSSAIISKLYQFLNQGGGAVFFLGDNVAADSYNTKLSQIMPAKLIKVSPEETNNDKYIKNSFQTLNPIETNTTPEGTSRQSVHTILSPFIPPQGGQLDKVHFYKYFVVEPYSETTILLRLSNGDPYLLERKISGRKEGKILLFTSTANREWNNLPSKPVYLPLIQQVAAYLSKNQDITDEDGKICVGAKIRREFSLAKLPDSIKITNPEKEIIFLKPVQDKDIYKIEFEQTDLPGIYQAEYIHKNGILPLQTYKVDKEYIPVNLDVASGESDLRKIDKNRLKNFFAWSFLFIVDDLNNIDKEFFHLLKGKELSNSLLLILIGMIVIEVYIANYRWGKRE